MASQWGGLLPVSIRLDLFLTLIVIITVTCCSAFERCPYRSCRTCDIEYLTCAVKCCQLSIYIYCCGEYPNGEDKTQDERPSSFPVSIVLGMGAAIILIILLTCILCVIHTKKAKTHRINTHSGANRAIRRMNRNGQEPIALQNSLEMSVIRKPPPYVENPPPYCQTESNINIYGDTFEDVQLPGTAEEINRSHSTLPPPYSETTSTLSAPRDTNFPRY
ncbi:hypothetical protein CHS0354_001640 [Potamilus streckersoni]|uniref:Uncharacterized protein n=1 Tax=Potamilus streckersoni TaxID=2493646 RepID=A0AAE0TEX0_9BIVA|nr:hypothetical protein CHS0354_001640 [Potamilus streckersoni]